MLGNLFKPNFWETIQYKGVELHVKVHIPTFVQATNDNPSEGGVEELEVLKLEYKGESLLKFANDSTVIDEVREILIDKLR